MAIDPFLFRPLIDDASAVELTGDAPPIVPDAVTDTPSVTTFQPTQFSAINLASIIDVSSRVVVREYVQDTMKAIEKESLNFTNTSKDIVVGVSLRGIQGVSFAPATFTLDPQKSQLCDVLFDVSKINQLPEGTSTLGCVMHLTSDTVLKGTPILPPPPEKIIPPPALVEGLWLEERFAGSPTDFSEFVIFAKNPLRTSNIFSINYPSGMPEHTTTRWSKKQFFKAGNYNINITTDDGMKVLVDGAIKLNAWKDQGATSYQVRVVLSEGQHDLQVIHYNNGGPGTAVFSMVVVDTPPPPNEPISPPPSGGGGGGGGGGEPPTHEFDVFNDDRNSDQKETKAFAE